ncbi:Kir-like protein [Plasmodium coatneyi]|uniref:Kir-like protein n=1 Tax=Plasmodium coatneyi TaxID=208452 RepID=A0A1B1E1N0_9APIC|nr:Kir-like protein [Plasmodium coatneyi]ANQ08739.1 Kir-like protein [Plasmodium coatneyi]
MEELQDYGILGENDLKTLRSKTMHYGMFEKSTSTCEKGTDTWGKQIRTTLQKDSNIKNHIDRILKALCYIYGMKRDSGASVATHCNFFYFWVGDMFWNSSNSTSFQHIMDKIKNAVEEKKGEHGCTFKFPTTWSRFFKQWKTVYEYTIDKSRIENDLISGKAPCTQVYFDYLQDIKSAYKTVHTQCKQKKESNFCNNIQGVENGTGFEDVPNLKCKLVSTAATPAIISSTIGTIAVGLPALAFFLYKYGLLPSWISSTFGLNSNNSRNKTRKRRSASPNIETLTADTSSLYSTADTSTDLSTTDNSTIYNGERPLSPRGGRTRRTNNNRRGGNENSRTISYQRM